MDNRFENDTAGSQWTCCDKCRYHYADIACPRCYESAKITKEQLNHFIEEYKISMKWKRREKNARCTTPRTTRGASSEGR